MLDYICGKGGIMYAFFLAELFISWPESVVYELDQIRESSLQMEKDSAPYWIQLSTTEQGFRPEQRVYCVAV